MLCELFVNFGQFVQQNNTSNSILFPFLVNYIHDLLAGSFWLLYVVLIFLNLQKCENVDWFVFRMTIQIYTKPMS